MQRTHRPTKPANGAREYVSRQPAGRSQDKTAIGDSPDATMLKLLYD